jgi:RNA polymerase sigma-70 factor (ECF subfamily)
MGNEGAGTVAVIWERFDVEDRVGSGVPACEAITGDAEAGRQFVDEHYRAIYRYLLYLTGRPDLAEDLTQETFLQAWRRLETFQGRGSLRGWLHQIDPGSALTA